MGQTTVLDLEESLSGFETPGCLFRNLVVMLRTVTSFVVKYINLLTPSVFFTFHQV